MSTSPSVSAAFRMADSLVRALGGEPVCVGTENAAKLGAVRAALGSYCEQPERLVVRGASTPSGVPEQPIGWAQIVAGARNRAHAARRSGPCALAVGIEDGLVVLPGGQEELPGALPGLVGPDGAWGGVFNIGCAWVTDGSRDGTGFSAGFAYPAACSEPCLRDQAPIGELFDALWRSARPAPAGPGPHASSEPSGRRGGNIGQLTQGRLDRSAYGAQAILCALVPFLHVDLYD
jgi:non-canonical (house-cleaning) NTP pyrophosphatase